MNISGRRWRVALLWIWCACFAAPVLADGIVVPEVHYPKVTIPNQQALIYHAQGVERLVIETSFLGRGTNFAWVVPLPSAPSIEAVSPDLFTNLRDVFRSPLIHPVRPYYAGILILCAVSFLSWRSLREEAVRGSDVLLLVVSPGVAWVFSRSLVCGAVTLATVLYARLWTRSPANLALTMLVGSGLAAIVTLIPNAAGFGLFTTLDGGASGDRFVPKDGVTILARQRAGLFETTTIQGHDTLALLDWLRKSAYELPPNAESVLQHYIDNKWVFVASKVHREADAKGGTALHPLLFAFPTPLPVYPTRLTALATARCAVDHYVFGGRRASARSFRAVRCDRVASSQQPSDQGWKTWLQIADPQLMRLIGEASVGTKLTARLSPKEMESDVTIGWREYSSEGTAVFSYGSALTIALNLSLPLAIVGWLLVGGSRGGWTLDEPWVTQWRWRVVALAVLLGVVCFLLLPKVEIVSAYQPVTALEDGSL